jgi:uncharacterized protein (TIGR03435 family)
MKRTPHDIGARLDRLLARHRTPSPDRMQAAIDRVGRQIGSADIRVSPPAVKSQGSSRAWLAAAATVTLATSISIAMLWPERNAPLHRTLEGTVHEGGTLWTNGGNAQLALTDGSRVEMRSQSEIRLERAVDGIRIRLDRGGIIVNAAKQRTGHLYVQTKDMTVSVVGTVFVVNADEKGSRVAVIEGEVRVQQGATETKLRPGERVASSPNKESFTVASELAWSRRAESLLALLQQSSAEQRPATAASQSPKEPRVAFEVVSIRQSGPAAAPLAGARGGGGGANSRPSKDGCVFDSFGYSYQIDPRRFAVNRTTLLHLVAYTVPNTLQSPEHYRPDLNCIALTKVGLLSGGPDWIRNDVWDVTATIPEGAFTAKPSLTDPVMQQMLKTLLAERFGLVMRRETREMPVYLLKLGKDGPKFNGRYRDPSGRDVLDSVGAPDGDGCWASMRRDNGNSRYFVFKVCSMSMANLASDLSASLERPVLDRTGLAGRSAFSYGYYDPDMGPLASIGEGGEPRPRQEKAIEEIGLRVEESRAPVDVWVIERAEKPTEN